MTGRAPSSFAELFGREPSVQADAPGRVNLIGEHTDYNAGLVLPMAIPRRTRVELAPREDRNVCVASADVERPDAILCYSLGDERAGQGWLDYVQGITSALLADGWPIRGFEARISSNIPLGAGLSSSAALEVALLRALREAFWLSLDDLTLAVLGQRAESGFVGAHVGLMDQLCSSLGDERAALFIDLRTLDLRCVQLPGGVEIAVVHSGVTHDHARGEYNLRRAECERAAASLGVASLRELDVADLPRAATLPAPLARRVRHVVTENARVLEAIEALGNDDLARFGRLLVASHASLRDDYAVSTQELDLLVALAQAERDVYGARLVGGGFGGSVLILARARCGRDAARRVVERYARRTQRHAEILLPLA